MKRAPNPFERRDAAEGRSAAAEDGETQHASDHPGREYPEAPPSAEGRRQSSGASGPSEPRRPGTKTGAARWQADRAMDTVRTRFGRQAIGYGSVVLEAPRAVPDAFRELAEKDL